jgi:hypothetical protein
MNENNELDGSKMSSIRYNLDPMKGPPDGAAADLQCSVTQFEQQQDQRAIKGQAVMPCTVYCSYEDGTIGISIRGLDLQIDLLVEEVMAIMQASAKRNQEPTAPLEEKPTDAELEEKWKELQNVKWDEADSPSGFILADAWWIFPQGVDQSDLEQWFNDRHSSMQFFFLKRS